MKTNKGIPPQYSGLKFAPPNRVPSDEWIKAWTIVLLVLFFIMGGAILIFISIYDFQDPVAVGQNAPKHADYRVVQLAVNLYSVEKYYKYPSWSYKSMFQTEWEAREFINDSVSLYKVLPGEYEEKE